MKKVTVTMDKKLLTAAYNHLNDILDLVDNYNDLAQQIQDAGFGNEHGEPFPTLDISGNRNMVIGQCSDLDDYQVFLPKKSRLWL